MTSGRGSPHLLPNSAGRSPSSEGPIPSMSFPQDSGVDKPQGSWDDLLPKPTMTSPSASGPPTSSPMGLGGQDRDPGGQERTPVHGAWESHGPGGVLVAPNSEPPVPPSMSALAEESRRRRMSDTPQKTFFTHAEKVLLTRLVEKHRNGLFNSNIRNKAETWRQLAQIYNSQPGVFPREPKQLKKCWENMKCRGIISPILQGERPRIRRYPRPMMMKPRPTSYGPPTMVPIRSAIPQSSPALLPPSSLAMQGQDFSHMSSSRMSIVGQLRARAAGLINPARAMNTMASLGMNVSQQRALIYSSAPSFAGMRLPFPAPSSQPSQHPHLGDGPMFGSMPPAVPPPPHLPASPSPSTLASDVPVVKIEPPDSDSPAPSPPPPHEVQGYSVPASASAQLFSSFTSGLTSTSSPSLTQASARLGMSETGMHLPIVNPHSPTHPGPSGQPPPSPPSSGAMAGGESDEEIGEENQDVFSGDEPDLTVSELKARLLRRKLECLEREHETRMRILMLQEDFWRLQNEVLAQQQRPGPAAHHGHPVDSVGINGDT